MTFDLTLSMIWSIFIIALSFFYLFRLAYLIIDERVFYLSSYDYHLLPHAAWEKVVKVHGNSAIKNIINISISNDIKKFMTYAKVIDPNHMHEWLIVFFSVSTKVAYATSSEIDGHIVIKLKHGEELNVPRNLFVNNQIRFKKNRNRKEIIEECERMFIDFHKNSISRFRIQKELRFLVAYISMCLCHAKTCHNVNRFFLKVRFLYKMLKHYDSTKIRKG